MKKAIERGHTISGVKFIADAIEKSVYVADGYEVEHSTLIKAVCKPYQLSRHLGGEVYVQGGRVVNIHSIRGISYYTDSLLIKYGYLEKYFPGFIAKCKGLPKAK